MYLPEAGSHAVGLVVEIDGSQHLETTQKTLDGRRDTLLKKAAKTVTVRIPAASVNAPAPQKVAQIREALDHPYVHLMQENYTKPLYADQSGLDALQIALSPLAIARLQRSVLEAAKSGVLPLEAEIWKIAVLERDVPCAWLGTEDLHQILQNLFALSGSGFHVPAIELHIYKTPEFSAGRLDKSNRWELYGDDVDGFDADLLIDISMLQRRGFTSPSREFCERIGAKHIIIVRTSHGGEERRVVEIGTPTVYSIPPESQPAPLVYFLQNIFRKVEFREGQVDILRRTLALRNVIALLPTGAGKSLTYQLSALLQPGITLVVDPLKSLMRDQDDNLRALGIDTTTFINSSLNSIQMEARCVEMSKGWYQFVFISPERLQVRKFRDYLHKMNNILFSYCVVDEAHCVSEWGHDFRTSYLRLGANARAHCRSAEGVIPIVALTGTASFDVLADVQRELDIPDETAIIAPSKYEREELHFSIVSVPEPEAEIEAAANQAKSPDSWGRKVFVAQAKQNALIELLNKIPTHFDNPRGLVDYFRNFPEYPPAGIVFCPHVNWEFGVKNILGSLRNGIQGLEPVSDLFAGGAEDDPAIDLDAIQKRFKSDEIQLLVATKAFGMGIDKPNIRFTAHFNMPQSIESFYQEAGRAGRDRRDSYCYIIYSPVSGIGEGIESVDKQLMLSFHNNSFRGIEKEKRILFELLDEIRFPVVRQVATISKEVLDSMGADVRLNLWPNPNPTRLYVNGTEFDTKYGYLDLGSLCSHLNGSTFPAADATEVLGYIAKAIQKEKPVNMSPAQFVLRTEYPDPKPGVERLLARMSDGDSGVVVLGFENDVIQRIADLLGRTDSAWTKGMVEKACSFCESAEEFPDKLCSAYRKVTNGKTDLTTDLRREVTLLFNRIRADSDTFKAVYRLSVLGCVDDYEVDYRTQTLTLTITRKSDSIYVANLHKYLSRYVSRESAAVMRDSVPGQKGDTVLQKCFGVLIGFVYSSIAAKRKTAIETMESAIKSTLTGGNFEEYVNTYFDSRYTPELRMYGLEYSLDVVWEYIRKTNGEPDAINHLRGACDRLLVEHPDNAALLLLRSFARLLIRGYDRGDALADFRRGWSLFRERMKWDRKEYLLQLGRFIQEVISHDGGLVDILGAELVQEHTTWLQNLNYKLTQGKGYA